jgi:predicted transcriptional regulator of viral defense system
MKYIDIQKKLEQIKVFWVQDLKILDDKYDRSKISKWNKLWYIKKIIRWFYLYSWLSINQSLIYLISNKIYFPSYISLESAFNYYWIIPEQTFRILAITTNKTIDFKTDIAYFSYKKVKNTFFWWYKVVLIQNNKFLIAELEKAILDYFYLKPHIKDELDLEWLRWNKDLLNEKLDFEKLNNYCNAFNSDIINLKVKILLNYLKHDTNILY